MRWTHHDNCMRPSADGSAIRHLREGANAAAADLLMFEGRHRLTVGIEHSDRASGFLYIGVVAADWPARAADTPTGTDPGAGQPLAWGLCPLNGHLHVCTDPSHLGARRKKILATDLSGRATGVMVVVHVDMERRTLAFEVDEGDGAPSMGRVDAQVRLPPAVRPWVLLTHKTPSLTRRSQRCSA